MTRRLRILVALASSAALLALAGCGGSVTPPKRARASSPAGPTAAAPTTAAATMSPTPSPTAPPTSPATPPPARTTAAAVRTTPPPPPATGLTVVLDPGHNGGNASHPDEINRQVYAGNGITKACNTTGTATNGGYPEHAFAWDVATRTAAILRARGVHVVLTRSDDSGIGPCVNERAAIGNQARAAAVVSIHGDGNTNAGAHGFHVIEPGQTHDPAHTEAMLADSDRLARSVRAAFHQGFPYATYIAGGDGLDRRTDLGGLNLSTQPTAMIECGNMRDAGDAATMTSASGRQQMASLIAQGILAFLRR